MARGSTDGPAVCSGVLAITAAAAVPAVLYSETLAHGLSQVATLLAVVGVAAALAGGRLLCPAFKRGHLSDPRLLSALADLESQTSARLAGRLHDTAVQSLIVATHMARNGAELGIDTDDLADQLLAAQREVRDVILDARGPDVTRSGLGAACQHLHELLDLREGLQVTWGWHGQHDADLPTHVALLAYQFLQETLTNSAMHAGVATAHASVVLNGTTLTVAVHDNGTGFDPVATATRPTSGLQLVAAKARLAGSALLLDSEPGQGTTVSLTLDVANTLPDAQLVRFGAVPRAPATRAPYTELIPLPLEA